MEDHAWEDFVGRAGEKHFYPYSTGQSLPNSEGAWKQWAVDPWWRIKHRSELGGWHSPTQSTLLATKRLFASLSSHIKHIHSPPPGWGFNSTPHLVIASSSQLGLSLWFCFFCQIGSGSNLKWKNMDQITIIKTSIWKREERERQSSYRSVDILRPSQML